MARWSGWSSWLPLFFFFVRNSEEFIWLDVLWGWWTLQKLQPNCCFKRNVSVLLRSHDCGSRGGGIQVNVQTRSKVPPPVFLQVSHILWHIFLQFKYFNFGNQLECLLNIENLAKCSDFFQRLNILNFAMCRFVSINFNIGNFAMPRAISRNYILEISRCASLFPGIKYWKCHHASGCFQRLNLGNFAMCRTVTRDKFCKFCNFWRSFQRLNLGNFAMFHAVTRVHI